MDESDRVSLDEFPGDKTVQAKMSDFKTMLNERHDLLTILNDVRGTVTACGEALKSIMKCPAGLDSPEIVAEDGRSEDEIGEHEEVACTLKCACARCRLICFVLGVQEMTAGWDYEVLEGEDSIKLSYRLDPDAEREV